MKNLVESIHFKKNSFSWKNNIKNVVYWKKLYVFLVTCYKQFHPKSPFYEEVKMIRKKDHSP
jgi:hypothetical protein